MPSKSALIIESDTAFANQLSAALQQIGFTTETIEDGAQGLARAKEAPPDLIALCVELPKMSGYAVCNKLKKSKHLKDVPLVIMSAEATPETFEQHRKLKTRADEYILKTPAFEVDEFLSKVRGVLPKGWEDAPPRTAPADGDEDDGIDLSFEDEESTGVDQQILEDANAALDALGADEDFDLNFGEDAAVGEGIEEDGAVLEEVVEEDGGLDLGLDEIADTAAAEAAGPAVAQDEALRMQLAAILAERDALAAEVEALKTSGGGCGR
jgi:DNA-binding response OmpR family regulator